jgi:hypothetical protein
VVRSAHGDLVLVADVYESRALRISTTELCRGAIYEMAQLGKCDEPLASEPSSALETQVKHCAKQDDDANDDKVAVLRLQLGHTFETHAVNSGDRGPSPTLNHEVSKRRL